MEEKARFGRYSRYLLVFAHPDDETYTCASTRRLREEGKDVDVVYVTSGDYQGKEMGLIREKEVFASMRHIGVSEDRIHFLRIPERQLMAQVAKVREGLLALAQAADADCILSHDFEGGHNGHDAVSFCASDVAEKVGAAFFVFPAYHGWPEGRLYNQFVPPREATETLTLNPEQKALKEQVIASHATQEKFFNLIKESSSADLFFTREILRYVSSPMDYREPPSTPIGYEYPGSRITFADFKKAIASEE